MSSETIIRGYDFESLAASGKASNANSLAKTLSITRNDIENITSIDYDPVEKRIYFFDSARGFIARVFLNGTAFEKIIYTGLKGSAGKLAVDVLNANIYFTSGTGSIHAAKLNGAYRTIVCKNAERPVSIALHPKRAFLFVVEAKNKILRYNLDGTSRTVIFQANSSSDEFSCKFLLRVFKMVLGLNFFGF